MVEAGERFWKGLWRPLYDGLEGNPFAAMPSLHFGTSVMAARVLSGVGRVHGAVGWTYALTLGFGLVYLGEHYVIDLIAGLALAEGVRRAEPHLAPAAAGRRQGGSSNWSPEPPDVARPEAVQPPPAAGEDEHPDELDTDEHLAEYEEDEEEDHRVAHLLSDHRQLASVAAIFVLGVLAIYLVFPKVVGFDESLDRIHDAKWYWVVVAVGFCVAQFVAYVALFRGVLGGRSDSEVRRRLDTKASYQITMAGLAATRIFSAAGAGGIVLTYWALRKAGMPRRRSACRMVAFLALTYSVYLAALIVFGVLLRVGVLPGDNPVGGTIVPAGIAGAVILVLGLVALIPGDFERRLSSAQRATPRTGGWPPSSPPGRPRCPRASAPPSTTSPIPAGARSGCSARWGSGPPRSGSCGPASRRSAATCRSPCWSRASSWAWRPT